MNLGVTFCPNPIVVSFCGGNRNPVDVTSATTSSQSTISYAQIACSPIFRLGRPSACFTSLPHTPHRRHAASLLTVPQGSHWVCTCVNFKLKKIFYHDSRGGGPGEFFKRIRDYLVNEAKAKVVYTYVLYIFLHLILCFFAHTLHYCRDWCLVLMAGQMFWDQTHLSRFFAMMAT